MGWVRNEQLDDLNRRVHESLKSLCNIITLGPLDEEHMKMNSEGTTLKIIYQLVYINHHYSIELDRKYTADNRTTFNRLRATEIRSRRKTSKSNRRY